jgi:hypothetical protein
MALANLAVSALRNFIPYEIRIPVFILIIAALVTVVDLVVQRLAARPLPGARHLHSAHRHQLHRARARRGLRGQERPADARLWTAP